MEEKTEEEIKTETEVIKGIEKEVKEISHRLDDIEEDLEKNHNSANDINPLTLIYYVGHIF